MPHRPRKQTPRRLPCSSERRYTSFKELGVASPQLEEFERDDNDANTAPNAKQSGKAQAQVQSAGAAAGKVVNKKQEPRKEMERVKAEAEAEAAGRRARSGSMRLVEWIMRTRSSSSAP